MGGFAVDNASLTRFFTLHFLLPFIIAALRVIHLFFLHRTGSRNPLGVTRDTDKINFNPANPLVTPLHIQPEWYFLFAYAILRRIPNKLGGVLALFASVAIFYLIPRLNSEMNKSNSFLPINKFMFWSLVSLILILT